MSYTRSHLRLDSCYINITIFTEVRSPDRTSTRPSPHGLSYNSSKLIKTIRSHILLFQISQKLKKLRTSTTLVFSRRLLITAKHLLVQSYLLSSRPRRVVLASNVNIDLLPSKIYSAEKRSDQATLSQCHNVTLSQCHTVTMSHCHNVTL